MDGWALLVGFILGCFVTTVVQFFNAYREPSAKRRDRATEGGEMVYAGRGGWEFPLPPKPPPPPPPDKDPS